jgi:hypothetical protein
MIHAMNVAVSEAAKRKMYVILYDEGMYPSGSSSGQVVEKNPAHAARGLAKIDLKPGEEPDLPDGVKLITIVDRVDGKRVAVVEQPSKGNIRGLHYLNEGEERLREDSPPAGDILNPDAVSSFIELVYERFSREFGKYFGSTIMGIFTDEPSPLGRSSTRGLVPGNAALLPKIKRILGYDITPHLSDLWYYDTPESRKHRNDYFRAINVCLEENYYKRLGNWCFLHNISLMGHPAGSMDIGTERYFQVPGQDLVWRYVEPGPTAMEGQHSTMAKCASSAMLHLGFRRNSNELYGAYGHNLTWDEMLWLASWCFVRGQNLMIPHAFYYSVRGPRIDERPPDVGPNSKWWDNYKPYADACRRLSWINTDSKHICDLAILCEATWLPDVPAKFCYQAQRDFNYLEVRHLDGDVKISSKGLNIAGMTYSAVVIDSVSFVPPKAGRMLRKLARNGHLIVNARSFAASKYKGALVYYNHEDMITAIRKISKIDLALGPGTEDIRLRQVEKDGDSYFILFNEGPSGLKTAVSIAAEGTGQWLDPYTLKSVSCTVGEEVSFEPHELKILRVTGNK